MMLLLNVFDDEDVYEFFKFVCKYFGFGDGVLLVFIVELKIDGLSLLLCYENGIFV